MIVVTVSPVEIVNEAQIALTNLTHPYVEILLEALSQICEKRLTASSCLFVRLSVRMEQLSSHWTDFHEIWYLSIFRTSVENIQASLKSDRNNRHFTWRPIYICDLSCLILLEWEIFQTRLVEKIKTHILCSINSFFENRAVYGIMLKIIVQRGRPCALLAG